ncbi:histidine phosphatase family protein [Ktedonobacter robiniae]|uniref:Phosphoglycerate mutase n=1 Tax=Ktedonobacter robiniae TaxID=2778365 RepID=A0ABQ3UIG4_9CHLR|nr:histidine phosphatase family protein [Ktedonobacter robiniae]GHO52498.1 phosphoglycerate mutase [Ktedonobacter robiniae]
MESNVQQDPFLVHRQHAAELFLIRHGDAIPEADEIIPSGVYDNLPLSKIGRQQAQALAARLKNGHFDAAYSSPLRRCQETGAPLLAELGLQATIVEQLKEIRLDDLVPIPEIPEGADLAMLTQALHERQDKIVRIAGSSGNWDAFAHSESSKAFRQRVVQALDEIASRHLGQRALIFAHGGVINAYVAEVLGLEKEFFFPCANTSLTLVRAPGDTRMLYILNDIAHLSIPSAQNS